MYSLTPIYAASAYNVNGMTFFGGMLIVMALLLFRIVGSNDIFAPKTKKGEMQLTVFSIALAALGGIVLTVSLYARIYLMDKLVPQHEVRAVLTGTLQTSKSNGVLAIYTTETNEVVAFTMDYGKSAKQEVTLYAED